LIDVVLLDVLMPQLDGYQVLAQLKADQDLRDIPVIMISALDEIESVVRCIEMGAEDYLPKPYNPVLLRARIGASLEKKRLRDQEVEYLRNVAHVTAAASAVEAATFDPASLRGVAERADALGQLARVFQRMAREVYAREQRLKHQLQQLRLDIEERQKAAAETLAVYLPMDRRQALVKGYTLPERAYGAALFADISGFTPLTEALAQELGLQRGAEEITRQLNRVYGALIDAVHRYGGSVINFSGDAITCWLYADTGLRATACGLAMQAAMARFEVMTTPAGTTIALGIKVAVVAGSMRRWLVGDPQIQQIEAIAGQTLDELAIGEHLAQRGEVLVQSAIAETAGACMTVAAWRTDADSGARFAVVTGLTEAVPVVPWPDLPSDAVREAQARPWLLPPVYERVRSGKSEFLSELRPAAVLFLQFRGIDYDTDDHAGARLDAFVRWTQAVLARYDGALLQLTIGDKGSYLYAAFGAPIAHEDDAARAVAAALDLQSPPKELQFIQDIQIGLAYGQMRAGAYGGPAHRTYGVLGDKANLAARLMQVASGGILCDDAIYQAAHARLHFVPLPSITVKGKAEPVAIYRPVATILQTVINSRIDQLEPTHQLILKVASVIGRVVPVSLLRDIYPIEAEKPDVDQHLYALEQLGLVVQHPVESAHELAYAFSDSLTQELAYNLLLFAQRRQLHRAVAEWYEHSYADNLGPFYPLLAHHWGRAEDPTKTIAYLERAGEQARQQGAYQEAAHYFHESLALDARMSVLSADYNAADDASRRSRPEEAY
jgi:class 3 adenylate cyclase/CheY-like chemotaxis protein